MPGRVAFLVKVNTQWIGPQEVTAWERNAAELLAKELSVELLALDRLAELFMPSGLTIPAAENDAQVVALLGLESSLFQDVRAFRHLVADGFLAQALHLLRAIYVGSWKAQVSVADRAFAERIARDETITDWEVRVAFAHVKASVERPGDWDHEAETLALIEGDYQAISRLIHKRKGGSEFQVRVDEKGDVRIFRDPPSLLLEDYGASIVLVSAVEVANMLREVIPFLLGRAGQGLGEWAERWEDYRKWVSELINTKWGDRPPMIEEGASES